MILADMIHADVPGPGFFFVFVFAAIIFAVSVVITFFMYLGFRRKNAGKIRYTAFVPLGCGAIIFAPFLYLMVQWIIYYTTPEYIPGSGEIVGHYHGSFHGAEENLDVRDDGTFLQTIQMPDGKRFDRTGKWQQQFNSATVDFTPYFYICDEEHNRLRQTPEDFGIVDYRYYYGDKAMVRDWKSDHYTLKKESKTP